MSIGDRAVETLWMTSCLKVHVMIRQEWRVIGEWLSLQDGGLRDSTQSKLSTRLHRLQLRETFSARIQLDSRDLELIPAILWAPSEASWQEKAVQPD